MPTLSINSTRLAVRRCIRGCLSMCCLALSASPGLSWADTAPAAAVPGGTFGADLKAGRVRPAKAPVRQSLQREREQSEIEMFVGESRVFPAPGVARVAVGNGALLTAAALDAKEVLLFANAAGTSSLFIWSDDGTYERLKINIVPGETGRVAREIATFVSAMPQARTTVIGDKVIVEGEGMSDVELGKVEELAKRYPQLVNFSNRLGWERMVSLELKVVEFPVTELEEIGVKWTAAGGAAVGAIWTPGSRGQQQGLQIGIPSGAANGPPIGSASGSGDPVPVPRGLNILSAINLGLTAQLKLMAQQGKATILAEPRLSTRSGSQASFLAGGEVPYQVSTLAGTTVQFKPYGIRLDIEPRIDAQGVIRARIDSEVSSIDPSYSPSTGPALLTRRTKTEFNLRSGETLVLAGLLSRKTSVNIDKVPFLGDLPVLGPLFRSRRFQNDETELVIFVTPSVVDPGTPAVQDAVRRAREKLEPLATPGSVRAPDAPVEPADAAGS